MQKRKCCFCQKLTKNWQRVNGSSWHCYDGCYSTTGFDRRTRDGQPAWEALYVNGKKKAGPWAKSRMI